MNKKGFTLIELLAVIVILAIIALIATPIILGIIDDARKSSSERGAELIVKNFETAYSAAYMKNGGVIPTKEEVYENFKMDKVEIDTTTGEIKPKDKGISCEIKTENNILEVKCIANEKEYKTTEEATMKIDGTTSTLGATIDKTNLPTGVKAVVYLDPTDLSKSCTASDSVSTTGTKTGCMKWYVYKEDSTSYTMILDHNTTAEVRWNKDNDNSSMGTTSGEIGYDLEQLTTASGWKVTPRLITGQEIANITGNTSWTADGNYYSFDTNCDEYECSTGENKYAWLFDYTSECTYFGCNIQDSSTYGYWTSTAFTSNSYSAWYVSSDGSLDGFVANEANGGLRPVITISKS